MIDIPIARKEKNPIHNIRKENNEKFDQECLLDFEKNLKLP